MIYVFKYKQSLSEEGIICDLLSENPTCLYNSVLEINAIEIHWVKNACYINDYFNYFNKQ